MRPSLLLLGTESAALQLDPGDASVASAQQRASPHSPKHTMVVLVSVAAAVHPEPCAPARAPHVRSCTWRCCG